MDERYLQDQGNRWRERNENERGRQQSEDYNALRRQRGVSSGRNLERQMNDDRRAMEAAQESIYERSGLTGADLTRVSPEDYDQSYRRQHYHDDYSEAGRGQAYQEDYGREQYGREQYAREGFGHGFMRDRQGRTTEGPTENFRGRGPKGYQRSDKRIQEDVCERLTDDHYLDATNIDVTCDDGIVTLEGTVTSRADKRAAEDIAESCSGVKDVHNRLTIETPSAVGQQTETDSIR